MLFGHAEQYVEGTSYVGVKLLDINKIDTSLVSVAKTVCERANNFLRDYEGFFGIDVMVDGKDISVLELNVRLTATTIPTLVVNDIGKHDSAEYLEEIYASSIHESDILLARSLDKEEVSVLRIVKSPQV